MLRIIKFLNIKNTLKILALFLPQKLTKEPKERVVGSGYKLCRFIEYNRIHCIIPDVSRKRVASKYLIRGYICVLCLYGIFAFC